MVVKVVLAVKSYIAHPYWAEREELVNIQKSSGLNRVRSDDRREKVLRDYIEKIGMSMADYEALQRLAAREWYRVDGEDSEIMIPRHQLSGTLVQATKTAPSGARFKQDELRSLVQISDFLTGKKEADSVFRRFVLPKDGKGNPLSNQRALRCNEVIENFDAKGTVSFDENDVKQKAVFELLRYAGKYIGVGASRKMGYGRFAVEGFTHS